MNPRPVKAAKAEGYPDRREFLAALAGGTIGLALTRSALATSPDKPGVDFKSQIVHWAAQLGDKDFKKRDVATKKLIQIGKGDGKDTKEDARARKLVLEEMESLRGHKDPEVAQRAKSVVLALSPPPSPPQPPLGLEGDIAIDVIE